VATGFIQSENAVEMAANRTSVDAPRVGETFVDGAVKVRRRTIDQSRRLPRLVLGPARVLEPGAELRQQARLHRLRLTQPATSNTAAPHELYNHEIALLYSLLPSCSTFKFN